MTGGVTPLLFLLVVIFGPGIDFIKELAVELIDLFKALDKLFRPEPIMQDREP